MSTTRSSNNSYHDFCSRGSAAFPALNLSYVADATRRWCKTQDTEDMTGHQIAQIHGLDPASV